MISGLQDPVDRLGRLGARPKLDQKVEERLRLFRLADPQALLREADGARVVARVLFSRALVSASIADSRLASMVAETREWRGARSLVASTRAG